MPPAPARARRDEYPYLPLLTSLCENSKTACSRARFGFDFRCTRSTFRAATVRERLLSGVFTPALTHAVHLDQRAGAPYLKCSADFSFSAQ